MRPTAAARLASLALVVAAAPALAGPLTPPAGVIQSTMKTLAEVEPRVAINAVNTPGDNDLTPSLFKITQPGSYYLTGNIGVTTAVSAIEVAASNVTIDLGGFVITGAGVGVHGVHVPDSTLRAVTVRDGAVSGFTGSGVSAAFVMACTLRELTVRACAFGARVGGNARVTDCTFTDNTSTGLSMSGDGVVENTVCSDNGGAGLTGQTAVVVRGSTFNDNGDRGLEILFNGLVTDCVAHSNGQHGFWLQSGGSISDSRASSNDEAGIYLNGYGSAVNNLCFNNTHGIIAAGDASRIDSNHVSYNTANGIQTLQANNFVVRNTARGNGVNYNIPAGEYGQIITNPGNGFVASNPWANFSY